MQKTATNIIDQPAEVASALGQVGLTKEQVVQIAKAVSAARSEYLRGIDPVNFPGTQAYSAGIRQLRLQTLQTLPNDWKAGNFRNIEVVVNHCLGVMISFQNVDTACREKDPEAISDRGEATRDMVSRPYEPDLFLDNEQLRPHSSCAFPIVWLVCVAASTDRLQVEVSRPKPFEGNQFQGFFERIFVADETFEPSGFAPPVIDEDEDDLDIVITKKTNGNS
jgi:hypothetical protein